MNDSPVKAATVAELIQLLSGLDQEMSVSVGGMLPYLTVYIYPSERGL